jgi:hypothetical protein
MDIEELRSRIRNQRNPLIIADEIGFFISAALRAGNISLYECYLLCDSQAGLFRQGYLKPAYRYSPGYRRLLSLIMLLLLARYYGDQVLASKHRLWLFEARDKLCERRLHYCDQLIGFIRNEDERSLLHLLAETRAGEKPFDDGPYHDEVFPYDYIVPEAELIAERPHGPKDISSDIVDLLVEIEVGYGEL